MAQKISSFKKLKALHNDLGGNKNGFYLTRFGQDMYSNKSIYVERTIAFHSSPSANWSTKLVAGKPR